MSGHNGTCYECHIETNSSTNLNYMNSRFYIRIASIIILSFTSILHAGAVKTQNVTVSIENGTLKSLFKMIEEQTSYEFSYKDNAVDSVVGLTFKMNNAPVSKVLDRVFKNRNLEYHFGPFDSGD